MTTVGREKTGLKEKLRDEVRRVMKSRGEMELIRSTVYEVLRLHPPVPLQYERARSAFKLKSHECSYRVEKGELLCGYQPPAMRDPTVFERPDEFVPDWFLGSAGRELLKYLFCPNGPEMGTPTLENKQCTAKDYVVEMACLLMAEIFNCYDEFVCDDESMNVTKLVRKNV